MLPANTVLANRYKLLDQLGAGGAAVVYRAEDLRLGRVVAVKVLRPEFVGNPEQAARFENEARAAAALTAPNVVDVYDYGRDAGTLFIVMQYIDGEDLKHVIRARGPLRPQEAARIAADVCNGLEAAHERGLIHRDVKPQNILIDRHGVVRITDFGVAKALAGPGLTQAGTTYGTAAYLSPEQATGGPISPATDVYALGIVLYEMLCGQPPFDGDNVAAVAYKQVYEPPPSVRACAPDVPPPLEAIVARAMAKDPAARYATAADMAGDLQGFLLTSDRAAPVDPPAAPAPWVPAPGASSAVSAPVAVATPSDPVPDQPTAAYGAPAQDNGSAYATWRGAEAARRSGPGGGKLAWAAIPLLALLLLGGFFGGRMLMNRAPGPAPSPTVGSGAAPPADTATAVAGAPPPVSATATPGPPTATPAAIAVPRNTPAPSAPPAPATPTGSKGRPVFPTPTPPTGVDRRVALEDLAFAGGYRYPPPSVYEGRTAVWVYGQGTSFASMTAPFVLTAQPTGDGHLTLAGMDSEGNAKTPMRILINGQSIFNGADPLPNDYSPNAGAWGTYTWTFPAAALRPGENTITIENLAPSTTLGIPFIMIDSATIIWDAEQ
jgi:serine/threonine-protein kinase